MLGDLKTEDDKLSMALSIAFNEISKDKTEADEEAVTAKNQA
jgi:hypothetical protein